MITFPPPVAAAVDGPSPLRWRIKWRGRTFYEEQVTGEHLAVLALLNGRDSWADLDLTGAEVSPTLGPVRLMSMLTALVVVDAGTADPAAVAAVAATVGSATAEELLAALVIE